MSLKRHSKALHFLLQSILCWFLASPAMAQNADVTLYVFKTGLPIGGIEVLVDTRVVDWTNDHGVAIIAIKPGLHQLELRAEDLVVLDQQIIAHEGEVSQWIVNITRGLSALTDVESSSLQDPITGQVTRPETQVRGKPGVLEGYLTDAEVGSAIEGARVFISGQSRDIRSAVDGKFRATLPAGVYSVSVLHTDFNTLTRDNIEVPVGGLATVNLKLTPSGKELPEFVVIEPYIVGSLASVLEERRSEAAVANILGAEQISKAGDSDAASALRRVTGLTLVDGRFIYVRGLGERYSSTLLNGADVPSPDATRRVVPLNLFPTGIVDSIAVKKGYTADLPGEFGGGTVELRTRSLPEKSFIEMELSLGGREGTTFADGLGYTGGGHDWTGYDDGARAPSDELSLAIADGTQLRQFNRFTGVGLQRGELEVIGESLPVNYDVSPNRIEPNIGVSAAGGYIRESDSSVRFGFLAAVNYKDEWQDITQQRTDFINSGGGKLESENDFIFNITERTIDLSGFFTTGLEIGNNHKLSYNLMLLRNTTNTAQVEEGFNKDAEGGNIRFTELEWIERQMTVNQLLGEHTFSKLGGLQLNWQHTSAIAKSDAPDTRRYRYDPDTLTAAEDDFIFSIRNDSNQRRWSKLQDDSKSWNLDVLQPLSTIYNTDITLMAGFNSVEKFRNSSIRRFSFKSQGRISGSIDLRRNQSVEDIIFAETIGPGGWQLEEVTIATDAYTAEQTVDAWYLGLDVNLGESLRVAGGVRNESSDQYVSTFNLFDPDRNPVVSELTTDNLFPYLTVSWSKGDHQLRLGYAETINRPDFKELSESLYKDPILDRLVKGNPDLQAAYLSHYDLRWDYYFNPDEFISLGVFYKKFSRPIESVILASADNNLTSFANAEAAENFGIEFELYKSLGFLDKRWGWGSILERFYVNANYARIDSQITLPDNNENIQTSDKRPLQGQSPYVLNFQLGYDDELHGINAALLFNVFGKRIVDVGINGAPDILEQPRPSLDFIYTQGFGGWRLKFKLNNLLDPDVELTQGIETTRITKIGREYSIEVQFSF